MHVGASGEQDFGVDRLLLSVSLPVWLPPSVFSPFVGIHFLDYFAPNQLLLPFTLLYISLSYQSEEKERNAAFYTGGPQADGVGRPSDERDEKDKEES